MGDAFSEGHYSERPLHRICVNDFYLAKHEATQGLWKRIMKNNPASFPLGDQYPVETVSKEDVGRFLGRLNRLSDAQYRLPTEAEWEYACRSRGKKIRFGHGKNIVSTPRANFDGRKKYRERYSKPGIYREKTMPAGSFAPNRLGLYDMSGNVWEWVSDRYSSDYYSWSPEQDPKGPEGTSYHVFRGGSWFNNPWRLRCSDRSFDYPSRRMHYIGFRLARTPGN